MLLLLLLLLLLLPLLLPLLRATAFPFALFDYARGLLT